MECDKKLKECLDEGKNPRYRLGRLHGIPFSVKDHIAAEGTYSTVGIGLFAECSTKDHELIRILKKEGGIPIVKGNVAVACMSYHTDNGIYGEARNPWNQDKTCGGSSGGDAALVAAHCVPFSIGSDLVGSLRVPAMFNGVYTLVPTFERISLRGIKLPTIEGTINTSIIRGAIGPITRNVDDLIYLTNILFSDEEYYDLNPRIPKVLFDESKIKYKKNTKTYKIGVISNTDLVIGNSLSVRRALESAAQALEMEEHEVVDIQIPDIAEQCDNMITLIMKTTMDSIFNDWFETGWSMPFKSIAMVIINSSPKFMMEVIIKILKFFKKTRPAHLLNTILKGNAEEIVRAYALRSKHLASVEKLIRKHDIDVMLLPSFPIPAFDAKYADDIGILPSTCRLASYWQYPSSMIPITTCSTNEQEYDERYHNDYFTTVLMSCMETAKGLPVGVEICGKPYQDETILSVMKIIEKEVQFSSKHPYPEVK